MLPMYLILAAAMLAAPSTTHAQEAVPREEAQPADGGHEPSEPAVRRAIPRAVAPRPAAPPQVERAVATPETQAVAETASAAADQRRAGPRGNRPQGDNPRTGTAVPRGTRRAPPPAARARVPDRGRTVIVRPPTSYNNYYSYPRRSYPHGYGAFGLGYFYYDPYRRYPGGGYSTYAGPGYSQSPYGYGFDIGELRLQVSPRHAQVYVDGYYAGTVDDYDGTFQALKLESGAYQIEIVEPGYETLAFDVRINPGQKITYRGDLRRQP